jgi:signal transduction histidine kinase
MEQKEIEVLLQKLADANRRLKLAQEQLDIANKKLKEYEEKALKAEKASQMKSLFLANMSHEIRTPLNAIEGFSRVIAETDSEEERLRYYQIIESNNQRLTNLINDILDLSRVESGEVVIKKSMTDLDELCDGLLQMFKFRVPENLNFEFKKSAMSAQMNTDANRLTQVFSNLISNALKHTTSGSIIYGYRVIDEAQRIEFFVQDTGTGISADFLPHIFDIYASQDADQQKGFGLGLAYVKKVIDSHQGEIKAESELGKGTKFTISLPILKEDNK